MKKSLVALAALAATSAFAQSSVTIYGVADVGYRTAKWTDAGAARGKASGVADGAMAGNRFGFRGTEDLGGGLKANFVIEQGISFVSADLTGQRQGTSSFPVNNYDASNGTTATTLADSGRTTATNRQSWLGLNGGFGEVRLGYQYTTLYEISTLSGFNAGSEGTHGADTLHTVFGGATWGGTRANGVSYTLPTMGGLALTIERGAKTDQEVYATTGASAGYDVTRTGLRAAYTNGPLKAMYGHTSLKSATSASGSMTMGASTTAKLDQLGASYNLGSFSVMGTYAKGDDGAATKTETKAQQIGVKVPVGNWTIIATTGSGDQIKSGAKEADVKQTQMALNYTLSKRTTAYVYTGTTKDNGTAAAAVEKKTATIIGVLHTF